MTTIMAADQTTQEPSETAPPADPAPPPTPGVDGAEVDDFASIHAREGGPRAGSVDEGSSEPAGEAVPAPS